MTGRETPTTEPLIVTAAILVIGNEVLSGRTKDANIGFLTEELSALGIQVQEARIIRDDYGAIIATLNELRARYDYIFTTGGIGPTHDDITAEAVARAFGVRLLRDPRAVERLMVNYRPDALNEGRMRMANIPEGAELIDNPVSLAPGFRIGNVHVMAGVPNIMRGMFAGLKASLRGGAVIRSVTLAISLPEGAIALKLAEIQERHPEVEIGSYPFVRMNAVGTAIVLRHADPARITPAAAEVTALVTSLGGTVRDETAPWTGN